MFYLIALSMIPMLVLLVWISRQRYVIRREQAIRTEMEVAHGVATTFAAYVQGIQR